MSLVDAQRLQRSYGERVVLASIDFAIRPGERIGLVGDNGAGKSTLARILAGIEMPDGGEVHRRRGARIAYLSQTPSLPPNQTALEVALSGQSGWLDAKHRYDRASEALARSDAASSGLPDDDDDMEAELARQAEAAADLERLGGWDIGHRAEALLMHVGIVRAEQPVGQLSGGEQRRVALAQLLMSAPDLAILDEPTNHLDIGTIEWLEQYLSSQFSGALLLITHDRYVLDRVASRTWEIDHGALHSYEGGYAEYLEGKAARQAHAARAERNRQNFLRRELAWLRQSPKARTTKQKARVERAEAARDAPRPEQTGSLSLAVQGVHSSKTVLELRGLDVSVGDRSLVSGLDLILAKGERIGILGPNGAGKTTLLKTILGEHPAAGGQIALGKNVVPSYLSQTRDSLRPDESVLENVAGGRLRVQYDGRELDARGYLQLFFFEHARQNQPVASLSGGERTRVALAKLLCRETNLLVLDEPTNDLDVGTLGALEDMLTSLGGSALVVTHDRYFLDRVATDLLVAEGSGRWVRYAGGYRDYLAQVGAPGSEASAPQPESTHEHAKSRVDRRVRSKPRVGLTYAERLELDELPERVDRADARVSELQIALQDPALYRERAHEVATVKSELEQAERAASDLLARWEALEARRSEQD